MAVAINNEVYEKRPFESWEVVKELRSKHFWHTWHAQEEGEELVLGMVFGWASLLAGIGNFADPSIGPHFTRLARTPNAEGITQAVEAAEAFGLGRDVCGAMKAHLGQLFQGLSQTSPTGEKFKHDFAFCRGCHAIVKSTQIAAEYLNVPILMIDGPPRHRPKSNANISKYLTNQIYDAIEWLEKTTGKEYDDEGFIDGVKNEWHAMVTWAKCVDLLKNVPTPASQRTMFSLRLPLVTFKHRKEASDYIDLLYAELQERVKDKVSDHKYEKVRLTHENLHPLYRADVLRSPELYGAVFVIGASLETYGAWDILEDGSRRVTQSLEERGMEVKNREDAVKALVLLNMGYRAQEDGANKSESRYRRATDWNCGGVVIHNDFPCQPAMFNSHESRLYLQEKGIPVGIYTASQGDPRDFDERRILGPGGELPTFYESLGLTRLDA